MAKLNETHPELAAEWDYDKNTTTPNQVSRSTRLNPKPWWKCSHGHSFQASLESRTIGHDAPDYSPCPHCAHTVPTPGEYSFATECPDALAEWDWEKNNAAEFDPDNMLPQSSKKVHWKCSHGHEWTASLASRFYGYGCSQCLPRSFCPGVNDLATVSPFLAKEWHSRNEKEPSEVHCGSTKTYWWKCSKCDYEWDAPLRKRREGEGCPNCRGNTVTELNNLAALYPEIATEWNYERNKNLPNGKIKPEDYGAHTSTKVAWICPANPEHRYEAKIGHRTSGYGCPFCSHRQIKREDSLGAKFPDLVEEWDYEKNGDLDPYSVAPGADASAWWKCKACGHEWKAAINDRTRRNGGCFECKKNQHGISYSEQLFFLAIKRMFPEYNVVNRYRPGFVREIDIFIEELKIGIEPGHWIYHRNKIDKDEEKRRLCAEHGIRIITIYESVPDGTDAAFKYDFYSCVQSLSLTKNYRVIRGLLQDIFKEYDIPDDVWADETWNELIQEARAIAARPLSDIERSLAVVAPDIAAQWSPNNTLSPEQVYAKSNHDALWICDKGHEFSMSPGQRMKGGNCNICRNRVADPRYNTIQKLYPEFVEWLIDDDKPIADTVTPGNCVMTLHWVCPECNKIFERTPGVFFKFDKTECPHCGKTFSHTPFNQMEY